MSMNVYTLKAVPSEIKNLDYTSTVLSGLTGIDKEKLITNMKSMINALEYDSMRSAGKSKINAQTLYYLYELLNKYNTNSKMATPKKETK